MKQYKANQRKYKEQKRANSKKTRSKREEDTLAQLAAFQNKLSSLAQFADYNDADEKDDDDDLADDDISWYRISILANALSSCSCTAHEVVLHVVVLYEIIN